MDDKKPLNIAADQEIKPDIEVTTSDFRKDPSLNAPPSPAMQVPETDLQKALMETLGKVTPPAARQSTPTPVIPPKPVAAYTPAPIPPMGTIPPRVIPNMPPPPAPASPLNQDQVVNASKNPAEISGQKPIRTYESDIAEVLSHNKTSTATIAIAESKKEKGTATISSRPKSNYSKQILFTFLSILLIAGGVSGGYYLYLQSPLATPKVVVAPTVAPSLVPADKRISISIDTLQPTQIIPQIYAQFNNTTAQTTSDGNYIVDLLLSEKSAQGISTYVTASDFIQKISLPMPDIVARTLNDTWMLGDYTDTSANSQDQKTPFLVFQTDFFQNAYAGMLTWESSMADDLAVLLNYEQKARAEEALGDTSSTSPISAYFGIRGKFTDKEIENRDVREFVSDSGQTLFLYSFVDNKTLIITTTESALSGLIDRIEKQTYVR